MKVVTQHFIGTTEEWKSENPKLYNAVWGFEKTVDGKIFLKIGNGVALWNDLEYVDKNYIKGLPEELAEIKNAYDWMENAIKEEAYARKGTDELLEATITAEVEARGEADQDLQEQINSLVPQGLENIPQKFAQLEETVGAEAEVRTKTDASLWQAINAEAQFRTEADQSLQTNIEAETQSRTEADQSLQTDIEAETQSRTEADQNLQKQIDALSPEELKKVTDLFILQEGLDTTEPFDDGNGVITIPESGIVEVNGVLLKFASTVTLVKEMAELSYFIKITDNGDGTAGASLVTSPGVWNHAKQGSYNETNERILDWISDGDMTEDYLTGLPVIWEQAVKGKWNIKLKKGWYFVDITSGLGGGNGGEGYTGDSIGYPGGGGVPSIFNRKIKAFFVDNNAPSIYVRIGGNGTAGAAGTQGGYGYYYSGGGGGGGSGSGEESYLNDIICPPINGGNGGNGGMGGSYLGGAAGRGAGGGGGGNGGNGGMGITSGSGISGGYGGGGSGDYTLSIVEENIIIVRTILVYSGGGGGGGGGSQRGTYAGGNGGSAGVCGKDMPAGSAGGYCIIYGASND